MSSSLTSWHRKYFCGFYNFAVLSFFLSGCIKPVPSCSDVEEPQKDAADAPSTRAATPEESSAQEVEPAAGAEDHQVFYQEDSYNPKHQAVEKIQGNGCCS
jgi:hypothetical protein